MERASEGGVFWITALSGAGKCTVAARRLDGDVLRGFLGVQGGHDPDARRRLAFTDARLCRELTGQGLTVVCATMSMFHEVRRWNRGNISGYREIYLRVPHDERARRDAKGLYATAAAGAIGHVVGVHVEPA